MAKKVYTANVKKTGEFVAQAEARGFKLIIDEPESIGGTNKGMNPIELLLCSLGSCQTIAASIFAKQLNITLEEFKVEIEGDFDSDGFMGINENLRCGYERIRFHMYVKSNASEEKIKELVELVERRCPVGDSIRNGIEFEKSKVTLIK